MKKKQTQTIYLKSKRYYNDLTDGIYINVSSKSLLQKYCEEKIDIDSMSNQREDIALNFNRER